MSSRIANLDAATFWSWLSQGARILALGATLPWVVTHLAVADAALWYAFATLLALQLVADIGFSNVFARSYALAIGGAQHLGVQAEAIAPSSASNWELLAAAFATSRRVYLLVAVVWLVIMATAGVWSISALVAQSSSPTDAWTAFAVVGLATAARLYGNVYVSLLFGSSQIPEWRKWESICWLLAAGLGVGALQIGGGLLLLTVLTYATVVLNVLINARLTRQYFRVSVEPEVPVAPDRRGEVWQAVWPRTWRTGVGVVLHAGTLHALTLVVARIETASLAASYLLAYNVVRAVDVFAQAPFYTKLPVLAAMRTRGLRSELVETARRGIRSTMWVLVTSLIVVGALLPWALQLVGSKVAFVRPDLWALMSIAFFFERYAANHLQLFMTTNQIVLHIANGIAGVLILLLVFIGYGRLGLYSIPLAQIVSGIAWFSVYAATRSYASIDARFVSFERSTALGPLILLLIFAGISAALQ